MAIMTRFSTL
ncbi:vegetative cell wall protein gp1-like [Iris pallida]|uniref:Vegetative cell wall protein gp1-like n=1 Tax=Iris pallida TaxID=29817 RepID=A0AAX6I439_IRIPA|nr:vegetative cell wall protein gp1-like [Iris pallida]